MSILMADPETAEAVAAGMAFLDEHDEPGWWRADAERAIDLDALDLSRGDWCVLGQRCPLSVLEEYSDPALAGISGWRYHAYARALSGLSGGDREEWACRLGFMAGRERWGALTAEWKRALSERREQASAVAS